MDVFMQRIQHDLTTDGEYADNYTLQLVAWNLERKIVIYDTFDFHQIELSGQRPWSTANSASIAHPIYIAYRQHRKFSLYDAEYNPLRKLEGHYSMIIGLSFLSNSNQRSQCPHTIIFSHSTAPLTIPHWETAGSRHRPDYKPRRTTTGPSTAYTSSPNPSNMANWPLLLDTGQESRNF
jgi:hypothetical protein